jgi:hypothetical protein
MKRAALHVLAAIGERMLQMPKLSKIQEQIARSVEAKNPVVRSAALHCLAHLPLLLCKSRLIVVGRLRDPTEVTHPRVRCAALVAMRGGLFFGKRA